MIAVQAV